MKDTAMREQSIIVASKLYLTFQLPRDIAFGGPEMVEFIENNKMSLYEDEPVEVLLNLISTSADTLEEFARFQIETLVDTDQLDALQAGAEADIWYDAAEFGDKNAMTIINNSKKAMTSVSSNLKRYIDRS